MINDDEVFNIILAKFPGFKDMCQEHLEYWGEEKAGLCNDMAVFSRYSINLLKEANKNISELKDIFLFIEKCMLEGNDNVKDATATCFLENIINATSWETISSLNFVQLLGCESKKFCKAWDEFTGVKTEGLWHKDKE